MESDIAKESKQKDILRKENEKCLSSSEKMRRSERTCCKTLRIKCSVPRAEYSTDKRDGHDEREGADDATAGKANEVFFKGRW